MKLPKIGTVCAVTWLDSGLITFRTDVKPKDRKMIYFTTIGKLADVDNDRIILLQEWANGGDSGFTDSGISINSITKIVSYKE